MDGRADDESDAHSDRNRRAQIRATVRCRWPLGIATQAGHFSRQALGGSVADSLLADRAPRRSLHRRYGRHPRNSVPGYLPRWNPFFTKEVHIKVAPYEEIGARLHDMQIDPRPDISGVILTHLHHDHTGGLDHFPHTPIIVPRACWDAYSGFRGMMMGCLPQRWPIWLKPRLIEINGPREGSFASSYLITQDKRIFLVPTPGHAIGHASVVVRTEGLTYFLAGDATYTLDNLRQEKVDGVTYDPGVSLATLKAIKAVRATGANG